jgi:hypothetical protein
MYIDLQGKSFAPITLCVLVLSGDKSALLIDVATCCTPAVFFLEVHVTYPIILIRQSYKYAA